MTREEALRQAQDWCDAWNRRDPDGVMAHCAEGVALCSSLVLRRLGHTDGWVRGKAALRDYFAAGMRAPGLRFEPADVPMGVGAVGVLYRRESGVTAVP